MSARRSGRSKAPVKYTSDSEGSDFGNKKPRKSAAPKKRTKAEQEPAAAADGPKKRTKKDPAVVAAEHREKAQAADVKAQKAQHQKAWESWLEAQDVAGELLDDEPAKDASITQTDALKKYGLKKEELSSLKHFEKRNPLYNNTMKLFLEDDVKVLGFRKLGMLDGVEDEDEIVKKGEEIWTKEYVSATSKANFGRENANDENSRHKDAADEVTPAKDDKKKKTDKPMTPRQKWAAYIESRTVTSPDALASEPEEAINQSDCRSKFDLMPADLAVLSYFPKPNPKYKNTTKLFKESDVEDLAHRKTAVLAGVEDDGDEAALLEKGKTLFDEGKS
jgi:hypothetical protein